jgi:hypothetical protein
MAPTITPAASIGSRNRRLARDLVRYARTVAAFRRMAHPTAGHPLRFAMATRASGWTKSQFHCYIKPGSENGARSSVGLELHRSNVGWSKVGVGTCCESLAQPRKRAECLTSHLSTLSQLPPWGITIRTSSNAMLRGSLGSF